MPEEPAAPPDPVVVSRWDLPAPPPPTDAPDPPAPPETRPDLPLVELPGVRSEVCGGRSDA